MLKKLPEIIKLCYTPYSIFSPIPFFAIIIFLIAYKTDYSLGFPIHSLTAGVTVSLLSSFASNIWNHTNDLKEDLAQGKKNAIIQKSVSYRSAIILSSILYTISLIIVYYISIKVGRPVYLFFLIWALITWWYSDNILLGKIFGFRLKTHYAGELITYCVAYPMYTLSIWLIYSNLNATSLALALAFLFFGISVVLLKDIKDISGDRKAKLKTFGVVFSPSKLFKVSCIFLLLYYIVILNSIALNILSIRVLLIIVPFFYFIKNTFFHFNKKDWRIDAGDYKEIKTMVVTTYVSIIILGAGAFI
ncbi:1,4-dihydroxy-2-naphthoate octaprenyltransferase [uncultured archaeon]|nr:1,4-dihydroxy-2-naphthoate octaprenyltransferase [uncultured archaeon]